ncbi:MAG: hypothetical protein HY235_27080 [Acidobacteria bacterium]|nr:hypothetical protein [Acidobacteriota bacterium]
MMRQIAAEFSALGVTELSRTVCELLEWKRPNGGIDCGSGEEVMGGMICAGWIFT